MSSPHNLIFSAMAHWSFPVEPCRKISIQDSWQKNTHAELYARPLTKLSINFKRFVNQKFLFIFGIQKLNQTTCFVTNPISKTS